MIYTTTVPNSEFKVSVSNANSVDFVFTIKEFNKLLRF